AILGRNGSGKTTLLRALLEDGFRTAGDLRWGHEVKIGYFPQDFRAFLDAHASPSMTACEWLAQWDAAASQEELRGLLGQMLFRKDEGDKRTAVLSGGEAARLMFCKLMLEKPNLLAMDEPTNHLDLESINALNVALQRYQGTVLLVSHDYDLVDEVATRIWRVAAGVVEDFRGNYAEYQAAAATAV
ncbi:MAG: ATP-binding cassette domain-containing protein, partial [Terriglobales bacterium]